MPEPFSFVNDYSEGAHERILEALLRINREQATPYGEDAYSDLARGAIRAACGRPDADVHFLFGGTQTNLTLISAALRPHQGVIGVSSGHINQHETGAIEATGHKVIALPAPDGKLTAKAVLAALRQHYADVTHEHIVQPGMVYVSHPSEYGTLYTKGELAAIRAVCDEYGIPLYLDGARLGCALAAEGSDLTLPDIARLADAFYIGGTKMGAYCGEALVILNERLKRDFRYIQKQKGAMPAKGRLLGLQFYELFRDGLYYDLARHANAQAERLRTVLGGLGVPFLIETHANQLFPILERRVVEQLSDRFLLCYWEPYDETRDVFRLCTSWATPEGEVEAFLAAVRAKR